MAQGFLLIIVGVWLLLQTLVGDLPGRVLSLRHALTSQVASSPAGAAS